MANVNPFDINTGGADFARLGTLSADWRSGGGLDPEKNRKLATEAIDIANRYGLTSAQLANMTGFKEGEIAGSLQEFGLSLNPNQAANIDAPSGSDFARLGQLASNWRTGAGGDPDAARRLATETVDIANRRGLSLAQLSDLTGFSQDEIAQSMNQFGLTLTPRPGSGNTGLVTGQFGPEGVAPGSYDPSLLNPPPPVDIKPIAADPNRLQGYQAAPAPDIATYKPETYTPQTYEAQGYTAGGYGAQTRDAVTYEAQTGTAREMEVTPEMMVENRLAGIINRNSDLQRLAESRALAGMNARGLSNSSMAVGAAQRAVTESAMPIAMADAQTLVESGRFNVEQANIMEQFNKNQINAAAAFNADATNRALSDNQAALNRAAEFMAQAENAAKQFTAGEQNRAAEFAANAVNSAADAYANAQNNAMALEAQAQNTVNVEQFRAATDAAKYAADIANKAYFDYVQAQNRAAEIKAQSETQIGISQYETVVRSTEAQLDRALNAAIANQTSADAKLTREMDRELRKELAQMDVDIRKTLAEIERQTGLEKQAAAALADFYRGYMTEYGNIMTNPDMNADSKRAAADDLGAQMREGFKALSVVLSIPGLADIFPESETTAAPAPAVSAPSTTPSGTATSANSGLVGGNMADGAENER
jgi:hypothetical protein